MTPEDLEVRLDELMREVRRQGKAAIAAQASADACLDAIGAMQEAAEEDNPPESDPTEVGVESLVRALIPIADAIERIVTAASADDVRLPLTWSERLLGRSRRDRSLVEPLRLLASQMESVLEARGVQVDRRVGVPVQGDAHRVVETRSGGFAGGEPVVLSVVRPGYSLDGRCLREADVVASTTVLPPERRPED